MMQSLDRSLDILEYLFLSGDHPVQPSELSQALSLPAPTCVRILQDLVSRGYAEQVSRSAGYRPGPMISSLFCRSNVYSRLVEASRQPLQELSRLLHMQVNLAVMHSSGRIMLYYCGTAHPWPRFRFSDNLETATGRLLIAALPQDQQHQFSRDFPEGWSSCIDFKQGSIRFPLGDSLEIQGFLLQIPGYPDSAFGYGVPDSLDADAMFSAAREIQQSIIQNLRIHYQNF